MNVAAGPELAAAVTNAGGLGVIGGHGYTPKVLRQQVRANVSPVQVPCAHDYHSDPSHQGRLEGPQRSFRCRSPHPTGRGKCSQDECMSYLSSATTLLRWNRQYDYQKGQLNELLDVIIDEKATLFVCAVGVPPPHAVEKLHKAGIPIMNVS